MTTINLGVVGADRFRCPPSLRRARIGCQNRGMLVGRDRERREVELTLDRARSGLSATMALVGEPGIGKTALLDCAAELASGMQLLRARGVESEAQIPFASVLELLRPALALLGEIPDPRAVALGGALALRPARAQDRFAIGAGTLSLLAPYAEQSPVAVLIAVRDGEPSLLDGADLPTLRIAGLSRKEASVLLDEVAPAAATRLFETTAGNPLAMLELAEDAGDSAL